MTTNLESAVLETVTYQPFTFPDDGNIPPELMDIVAITMDPTIQMLPLTAEKLGKHTNAVIAKIGDLTVGYCAGTYEYKLEPADDSGNPSEEMGSIIEVGALVVVPEHRKHGIGYKLVDEVTKQVHELGHRAIAFCNPASAPLFLSADYTIATNEQVPVEALSPCSDCPMKDLHKNEVCCDVVYISEPQQNKK